MKIIADMHTHTIASDHAYSTLLENVLYAKRAGFRAIALTDHGPAVSDAPRLAHLANMKSLPESAEGVRIFRGVEANMIDYTGKIDVPDSILKTLDWVIASFHEVCCTPGTEEQHTQAYIGAAKNPAVDLIGHSGNCNFPYDYEKAVRVFKEYDKAVEINESSFVSRPGSKGNCTELIRLCKKYEVNICVNSDAHFASLVGQFPKSISMLEEAGFPEKLVLNADFERLQEYIVNRKRIR